MIGRLRKIFSLGSAEDLKKEIKKDGIDKMSLLIHDSFIPAFGVLEKTLKNRLGNYSWFPIFFTVPTIATPIANQFAPAGLAERAEIRLVQIFLRNELAPGIPQIELHGPPLETDAGLVSHLALHPFVRHPIKFPVFNEVGPGLNKAERNVRICALLPERLNPLKIAGPGASIILPATLDLLDLSGGQIGPDAYRADKRRAHNALMLERQLQQKWNTLICPALVFAGNIKKDVLPPVSPIIWEAGLHPLGPFCQQKKYHIPALAHDVPSILSPLIRLFQKEIRGHADTDHFTALRPIPTLSVSLEGLVEASLSLVYLPAVTIPHTVQKVHITVLTALAAFNAAVPGIPNIMHDVLLFLFGQALFKPVKHPLSQCCFWG